MNAPSILRRVRLRLAGWLTLRSLLLLVAGIAATALALILLDAALDLSESIRVQARWIVAAAALPALVLGWATWARLNGHRLARYFERRDPALGNRLSNAVQLAARPADSAPGEFFRREALYLGRQAASRLRSRSLVGRGLVWSLVLVALVAAAWGLTLGQKELTSAVFPRFRDPHGDHPPFSNLKFEVQPRGGEVLFGGQLEIRATTLGRPADKLWVVARTPSNETRAIMFLAPDRSFFQTLANLREPGEYFITDGKARSHRFPIRIRYTPQITLAEVSIEYPAYTGKSPRNTRLPDEPMALPEDTRLAFRVASNRPLKSGTVTLTPVLGGQTTEVNLQPDPAQPSVVSGAFKLTGPVGYSLSIHDVDGLACAEPKRGRINLSPDERPRLFVLEPGRNAVATPSIRVPIKVEAQDDYGVSRVVWLRGHNRSIERPFSMKLTLKNGARAVESAGAFELAQLGVRPGDVIDYYFEAADNYPKGPNLALSRIYRLEIISEEKYKEILRQTAARKALFEPYLKSGAWFRRLAEQARDASDKAREGSPQASEAAQAVAQQLDEYLEELAKLMRNPLMFDVEQSFRTTLVEQHSQAGAARDKLKQSLGGGTLDPRKLKEAADELTRLAEQEDEQVGQPARQIVSVVQVVAKADAFVRLAQQQAALAQMLRRFSDRTDALSRVEQIEVQELAHAEGRIRDGLKALLAQLPDLLKQVPEEPDYDALRRDVGAFLQAVADAKIEPDLTEAAKVLAQPDTMTAYVLAQQAAVKMEKLISKCSPMPGVAQECLTARFAPKLSSPGMGNSLQQILSAMGAGQGQGQGGQDGYGLFNEDVALYGPNVELAGEQAGGRREGSETGAGRTRQTARVGGTTRDPALPGPEGPGRLRLQPDAKFPLRYRDLVGEYFRAIAETETGGGK